ncbi:MAG: type 1 glutamine amidotransferase domain-containing protein [Chitinophagaceae bacterium]|nr:type 1 glutamine amidotransferase domain-containing protein [Chitinophagaceae bacterium]
MKVLFITTSHDKLGETAGKTGVWLEEIAAPYYIFKEAGADIAVASPKAGLVPLDPKSQSILSATRNTKRFLKDAEAMSFLSHSMSLEEVDPSAYDLVFLTGGHGPMWDLAHNTVLKQLLETFYRDNKPIGLVCHGVAGLLSLQNDNGEFLVSGKCLTGFSNSEEQSTGLADVVPFLLETELRSLGANYSKEANYVSHVVVDGNIITGQNSASSEDVAKKLLISVGLIKHHTYS